MNAEGQHEEVVVVDESSTAPPGYLQVRVGTLRIGSITHFELYIMPKGGSSPMLYTRRNTAVTADVYQSLVDLQGKAIYIDDGDLNIYLSYVEKNLPSILEAEDLSTQDKVEVMYKCAQRVMEGLISVVEAPNLMPRARTLVITISDFIYREDEFFKHFLKICTYGSTHNVNVLIYSLCFIKRMNIRDVGWIQNFCTGVLLLDLGKSTMDKKILTQKKKLNNSEWQTMKMHTIWSYEVLKKHGIIDDVVLNIARNHHEKMDGTGYPDKLKGDAIPQYVRIVTICDIFDALTTKRAYNDAAETFPALKLMNEKMHGEIDQDLFKTFVQMMSSGK